MIGLMFLSGTGPREVYLKEFATLPDKFRRPGGQSEHSLNQKQGRPLDSFLEGPVVVGAHIYLTDIPYGRVFRLGLNDGLWELVVEYDGEPNGLAWHAGKNCLVIADFKNGILLLDPADGSLSTLFSRFNGERLRGPNDLIVSSDGSIFFTDQGMSGLQNPNGRVFRLHPDGKVDVLLSNGPSPNGLVLNEAENVLFVAMTRDNAVWHLPLYPDGTVQRTGRFSSYFGTGGPDGLLMDKQGCLLVAHSSLGVVFVHNATGELEAILRTSKGKSITNLTWQDSRQDKLLVVESATASVLATSWKASD